MVKLVSVSRGPLLNSWCNFRLGSKWVLACHDSFASRICSKNVKHCSLLDLTQPICHKCVISLLTISMVQLIDNSTECWCVEFGEHRPELKSEIILWHSDKYSQSYAKEYGKQVEGSVEVKSLTGAPFTVVNKVGDGGLATVFTVIMQNYHGLGLHWVFFSSKEISHCKGQPWPW